MKHYIALILLFLPIQIAYPLCEYCYWKITEGETNQIAFHSIRQACDYGLSSPYEYIHHRTDWIQMFLREFDSYAKYREGFRFLSSWLDIDTRDHIATSSAIILPAESQRLGEKFTTQKMGFTLSP